MSSVSRFLPGLMVATVVGIASGYYTFQPMLVEEVAAQNHGGLKNAEDSASSQGREFLGTGIRKVEQEHANQDARIEKAAAITKEDKKA